MTDQPRHVDVLIVGAGHAGAQLAIALRQRKYEGSIGLLGDELDPPYERPPLSKEYLSGEKGLERLLIRPLSFWAERDVTLLLGQRVVAVDAAAHCAMLADDRVISYGVMVWATGGQPRRLACAGHDLRGVHAIRSRMDVDRLIAELPDVTRAVVIGGGYIGLEAAAVLTKLDKQVTVLEAQDRVLARVAGVELSRFYETEHRAHGVDLRVGVGVDCIEGRDGAATGVRLADRSSIAGELIIVGIGIEPSIVPLVAAGARTGNGVHVDEHCRTTLNDIFAIGDCAAHRNVFAGDEIIRLESVQNANDQANLVAKVLTGALGPYEAVPWFWSNQFDLKLQTVGLSSGCDESVVRGDPATRSFSVVYLRGGRVIALDCVNAVKDYVQGRELVIAGARLTADRLRDTAVPLKVLTPARGKLPRQNLPDLEKPLI